MANTTLLKGHALRKEGVCDEAITPGHLVERGGTNDVQKHSTDGGPAIAAFAANNDLVGDGIDDAYGSGDTVQIDYVGTGAEINALLADGQDISVGEFLVSAGDGTLRAYVAASDDAAAIVASAIEAKVNSSGSAVRLQVEVL